MIVNVNGKISYGDVMLLADEPKSSNAVYVSLATDDLLPTSFAYPDAGYLVSGAVGTANVNGAYDAPVDGDQDFGVRCAIDKSADPACPQAHPDMRQIVSLNGASSGVFDYVRRLAPVLENEDDPVTGETVSIPRIFVRATSRTWTPDYLIIQSQSTPVPAHAVSSWFVCSPGDSLSGGTCTNITMVTTCSGATPPVCSTSPVITTYPAAVYVHMPPELRTVGQVDYDVQSTVDRFLVKYEGTYQKANSSTTVTTKTVSFDKTAILPPGSSCNAYINHVTNPFDFRLHPSDPSLPRVPDNPVSTFNYTAANPISDLPTSHFKLVAPMSRAAYTSPAAPHPSFGAGSGCP